MYGVEVVRYVLMFQFWYDTVHDGEARNLISFTHKNSSKSVNPKIKDSLFLLPYLIQ